MSRTDHLDRPPGYVDHLPARAATPEPPPTPGEGDVWAEIIARLPPGPLRDACVARRQMGIDKYGQPLQRDNGRNHAVDEAQEHLDAAAYRAARTSADDPDVMAALRRAGVCLGLVVEGHDTIFTCDRMTMEVDPETGVIVRYDAHRPPETRWEVVLPGRGRQGASTLSAAVSAALSAMESEVQVVRHSGTGEAVLMLTGADGIAWPVRASYIIGVAAHPDSGALVDVDGDTMVLTVHVRDSAEAIINAVDFAMLQGWR